MKIQKPICQLNSKSISNSFRLLCCVFAVHCCFTLSSLYSQRSLSSLADDMVLVEGGSFIMGGLPGRDDKNGLTIDSYEKPAHEVRIPSFYISKYEMTQQLWQQVMGNNPSYFSSCGPLCPVEKVSWYDCVEFCNTLSIMQGLSPVYTIDKGPDPENGNTDDNVKWQVSWNIDADGYRLPCEAEWEYAARGGNKSKGYQYSGSDNIDAVAWYGLNSTNKTHEVAKKAPNELGFFDFSGNVMEWTYDLSNWLGEDFFCMYGSTGDERVLRGGNMETNTLYSRTAFRNVEYSNISDASSSWQIIGFRLCRNVN